MRPAARNLVRSVPARGWFAPVLLLALVLWTPPLTAQRADFLFGRPVATVAVTAGWAVPGEGSDLFSFARDELTVSRGDFSSPLIMLEAGLRVTERLDVTVGFEYTGTSVPSEMRDWVYEDDSPILQTTEFKRYRLMAGVRAYLLSRGRSVSDYAWVPSAWSPYLAAGMGRTWYEFTQHGDFVNYETLYIFSDRYTSEGGGFTPYAAGGLDVSLSPYFLVRGELRYIWGRGPVDQAVFQDFNDIDLSGFRATLGFAFRTGGSTL